MERSNDASYRRCIKDVIFEWSGFYSGSLLKELTVYITRDALRLLGYAFLKLTCIFFWPGKLQAIPDRCVVIQFKDFQLEKMLFSVQDNTFSSPGDSMHNKENHWVVDKINRDSFLTWSSFLKICKNKKKAKCSNYNLF